MLGDFNGSFVRILTSAAHYLPDNTMQTTTAVQAHDERTRIKAHLALAAELQRQASYLLAERERLLSGLPPQIRERVIHG